jgi:hypothetical protein
MARRLSLADRRALAAGFSRYHIAKGFSGRRRRLRSTDVGARASLTTALTGTNNDLLFKARYDGTAGNSLRVRIVVSGVNTPLSVSQSGNDLTINSATNGASAATSTAAQVLAAVNAIPPNDAKVRAELAAGNDGTGVVTALAFTNLAGGTG